MIRQRLTVLRDLPDDETLVQEARETFRIFRSQSNGLYFVDSEAERGSPNPVFGAHYDSPFRNADDPVPEIIEVFAAESSDRIGEFQYWPEMISEAIALSRTFQTRVLSYYGDDEGSDFAAVAENGELLRLRFQGEREEIRKLSDDEALAVETEIHAERISPEDEGGVDVFEFAALEALYTGNGGPQWAPYWKYVEGEIGRRVVFRSLWHLSSEFPSDSMFRNAYVEFKEAFGHDLKDPYYEPEDYELVTEVKVKKPRAPIWPPLRRRLLRFVKRHPLSIGFVCLVIVAGLFADRTKETSTGNSFEENCEIVGGEYRSVRAANDVSQGSGNRCEIGGELYTRYELPFTGETPEPVAAYLSTVSCEAGGLELCPALDGKVFTGDIEGFTFEPGQNQILVLGRRVLCEQTSPGRCADGSPAFKYSLRQAILTGNED